MLIDVDDFLMDVGIIFDRNRKHFCKNISRSPKPPSTKQIDRKPQEHANNFRNMHKMNASKNADIEHLIGILQSTERKQLHQTSIYKIGGGGARAARRIQIRNLATSRDDVCSEAGSTSEAYGR